MHRTSTRNGIVSVLACGLSVAAAAQPSLSEDEMALFAAQSELAGKGFACAALASLAGGLVEPAESERLFAIGYDAHAAIWELLVGSGMLEAAARPENEFLIRQSTDFYVGGMWAA